jgi:hypothetical protein
MTQKSLEALAVDELVQQFEETCLAQNKALLNAALHKKPELVYQMVAIDDELRKRGHEARRALMKLYDHPNMQVRLQAAECTLAVAYFPARQVIETIARFGHQPQMAAARETLRRLDDGTLKPV